MLTRLKVVAEVRPHDPGIWTRYLYGMWLSGLRLQESIALSWDEDADFGVDLSGDYPAFRIKARAQKGRRSETVPMTPDLATWLLETPQEDRTGRVGSRWAVRKRWSPDVADCLLLRVRRCT